MKPIFLKNFLVKYFLINTRLSGNNPSILSGYKGELKREALVRINKGRNVPNKKNDWWWESCVGGEDFFIS